LRSLPLSKLLRLALPTYRAYLQTGIKNIGTPAFIEAETDDDAIQKAMSNVTRGDVELWEASRRVAFIKAAHVIRCD
jgi:hypothetical protein